VLRAQAGQCCRLCLSVEFGTIDAQRLNFI